jgi:DNA-binding transcriptional regulator YhcF (GntR family)
MAHLRELDDLQVSIDRDAEVPIGVQLAWALRSRIGAGDLLPGQRLPGLRDLAEATAVNVNTVRAVYQRLEQEGLIDSQQGSGTFVAGAPRRPSVAGTIAAKAAREAHKTGVDPREVAAALYVAGQSPAEPKDAAAERRRLLRMQIAALERTLGEMEASHPGLAPSPAQSHGRSGPALLGANELERVRTLLVRRLSILQTAIDERGEQRADERKPTASRARSRPRAELSPAAEPSRPLAPKRARQRPGPSRPAPAGT